VCDLIEVKGEPITDGLKLNVEKGDDLVTYLMDKEKALPQKGFVSSAYDNVASSWFFRMWPVRYLGVTPASPTDQIGYSNVNGMRQKLMEMGFLIHRNEEMVRNTFGELNKDNLRFVMSKLPQSMRYIHPFLSLGHRESVYKVETNADGKETGRKAAHVKDKDKFITALVSNLTSGRSAPKPEETGEMKDGEEAKKSPAKPFDPYLDNVTDEEFQSALTKAVETGLAVKWAVDSSADWARHRLDEEIGKIGVMPEEVRAKLRVQADMRAMLLQYVAPGSAYKIIQPKLKEFVEHLESRLKAVDDEPDQALKTSRRAEILKLYNASVNPPGSKDGRTDTALNNGWIAKNPLRVEGKKTDGAEEGKDDGKSEGKNAPSGEIRVMDEGMKTFFSDSGPGGLFKSTMKETIVDVYKSRTEEERKAIGSEEKFVDHALALFFDMLTKPHARKMREAHGITVEGEGDSMSIILTKDATKKLKQFLVSDVNKMMEKKAD
jgi:hypothetical protein